MKKTATVVFCLLVLAILTPHSSAKPVPLEAPDPGRGIIGARVKVIPPAKTGSSSADAVYFVRVGEDADRFGAESFITSNYSKGRNVYLLNAKPGRYVAIGCMFEVVATGVEGTVVFSKADILQTEVEVRAGGVVFMGAIKAQSSTKVGESDEAQAHYLRIVSPTAAKKGFMARAFTGDYAYIAAFKSIERSGGAETEFWAEATEHFKDQPAWTSRISGRSASPVGVAAGSTPTGATEATSPITTDLPLVTLYKNLSAKNYYPGLEGLKNAQADVKSNILDHLVAVFPDAAGKPITARFYWSKPSPEAIPEQKFGFMGPQTLSIKAKQRWQITPDVVINAPIYETFQITKAMSETGVVTVSGRTNGPDAMGIVLHVDGSTWQVREIEMDLGGVQAVQEMTSKDLGGKWGVESTVLSSPQLKQSVQYEYTQVEEFWLPSRISVDPGISFQEQDGRELRPPFVFDFTGWQVNKGIPEGTF